METGKTIRAYDTVFIFAKFCGISNQRCRHCSLNDVVHQKTSFYQVCLRDIKLKCGNKQIILTKEKFKELRHKHLITLK